MNKDTREELGRVWRSMIDQDLIDDRREYDIDMLQKMYVLNKDDAKVLYLAIQGITDPRRSYHQGGAHVFLEMVQEAIHQGLDGWSDHDQMVIVAFLSDIGWGINHSQD